jgi:sugar phosphate isomerase/epimerase
MEIGCGTVNFRKYSLNEALERIAKAGYEYVEPQATIPFCPHVNVEKDDPRAFSRLIRKSGFKGATALWAPHGAIIPDKESVAYVKKAIQWAGGAEIPVVNASEGWKPDGMSDEEAWNVLKSKLDSILESAEASGVYLAIEPHGTFSLTADGLKRIMSLSSSKWLGINYDPANVHRAAYVETVGGSYSMKVSAQKDNEVTTLAEVADRVRHVHVKDIVGTTCVALGKGEVDLEGCLRVLKDYGYDGALSLETEGEATAEESQKLIEDSRSYLIQTLKKI